MYIIESHTTASRWMINKYGSQREQLIINGAGTERQRKKKNQLRSLNFSTFCISIPVKYINWPRANLRVDRYEKLTVGGTYILNYNRRIERLDNSTSCNYVIERNDGEYATRTVIQLTFKRHSTLLLRMGSKQLRSEDSLMKG